MRKWIGLRFALSAALLAAAMSPAQAQTYPSKAVRLIVPSASGGPNDSNSRGIAQALGEAMGQPFVVENRPGADGIIGTEACARSTPDGHTLCTCDGQGFSLNPVLRANMPYEPLRDLSPVILTAFLVSAVVVHPSVGASSVRELMDIVRAKPGSVTFGTSGLASVGNIYVQWLRATRGLNLQSVPYKSTTLAFAAMLAGEVQVTNFTVGQVAQQLKSGKLKALAQSGEIRSQYLPDVPTFKEAGMELSLRNWFGLFAPAGTPRDIVQRLNAEVGRNLLRNQGLRERYLEAQGLAMELPVGESPDAFAAFLKADRAYYANIIKTTGIRLD